MTIQSNLLDLHQRRIYPAEITVENGRIRQIQEIAQCARRFRIPASRLCGCPRPHREQHVAAHGICQNGGGTRHGGHGIRPA
jgi:hypothetical protein